MTQRTSLIGVKRTFTARMQTFTRLNVPKDICDSLGLDEGDFVQVVIKIVAKGNPEGS